MTKRAVWKVIVFGIITLGIYDVYWLYKTRLELVAYGHKIPRVLILFVPVLGLILAGILAGLARSMFKVTTDADLNTTGGVPPVINILTILISIASILALIIIPLVWFYAYSKAVHAVTYGATSFSLAYLMFILLNFFGISFVWPGIIQDGFNSIDEALRTGQTGTTPLGQAGNAYVNPQFSTPPTADPAVDQQQYRQ